MKKNKFLQIFFSVYNHLHNGFKTLSKNVWLDAPWLKKLRAPGQTVKKNESGALSSQRGSYFGQHNIFCFFCYEQWNIKCDICMEYIFVDKIRTDTWPYLI